MPPELIKKQGITIGKLYTHDNGTLQMRDVEDNYTIGWYYPKIDKTYGHGNKPVGRGNLLLNLLNERLRKGD